LKPRHLLFDFLVCVIVSVGDDESDPARLRRVRDRIDREYAQPLDVEALARGPLTSAGHLSRELERPPWTSPPPRLRE